MDNGPFALLLLLACLVLLRLIRRPRANMRMAWEAASSETLAIAGKEDEGPDAHPASN